VRRFVLALAVLAGFGAVAVGVHTIIAPAVACEGSGCG
jgi:hypothetical protein